MIVTVRYLFSEIYCGGYSGEDPPLPIPNREVKLTSADGTAPPGGRVGSCHFSYGGIAQLARAPALQAGGRRFDSDYLHKIKLDHLIGLFLLLYQLNHIYII